MNARPWIRTTLGQVLTLQRGFDLPTKKRKPGSIPIVSSSGISGSHDEKKVTGPGVVTGRYGTIGQVFFIDEDFWPLNTTLFIKDFKGNDPQFFSYILQTIDFQSHSDKSGVPGVNRNDLHKEEISIPLLTEQRAIAAALDDADALIIALGRLIAKKRDVKQGAMQELLTGKRRLPGFEKEWKYSTIRDVAIRFVNGGTPSTKNSDYWGGNIEWTTSAPLTSFYLDHGECTISIDGLERSTSNLIPKGNVIIATRVGIGKVVLNRIDIAINQDLTGIILDKEIAAPEFFVWTLLWNKYTQLFASLSRGTTIKGIVKSELERISIPLPSLDEQTAIATALSDMDAEIAALEAQREKAKQIKQGMMQELLTGRIRLV